MTQKNLYVPEDYQQCLTRIERLSPDSKRQWGTMTVAQMLGHCAEVQEVTNGKELRNTPFLVKLFKGMVRNMVVSEKPYPRSARTHHQYRMTEDLDFEVEKKRLLEALEAFTAVDASARDGHPFFGRMTADEKGWSLYKHLDHHMNQFGV